MVKRYTGALALGLILLLVSGRALAAPALTGKAQPEGGSAVQAGDVISYEYEFSEGSDEGMAALRAELSEGLEIMENSVQFLPAASEAAEADIIYGNDGFVLIASAVRAGDKLTFKATVGQSARAAQCILHYGEAEYPLGHELLLPATPQPRAEMTPTSAAQEPEQPGGSLQWVWIAVIVGICGIGAALFFLIRKLKKHGQTEALPLVVNEAGAETAEELVAEEKTEAEEKPAAEAAEAEETAEEMPSAQKAEDEQA